MTLDDLKQKIKGKKFLSQSDYEYKFVGDNTFYFGPTIQSTVQYNLYEKDGQIYFDHGKSLSNNDLIINVQKENPLTLELIDPFSPKNNAVWTEKWY